MRSFLTAALWLSAQLIFEHINQRGEPWFYVTSKWWLTTVILNPYQVWKGAASWGRGWWAEGSAGSEEDCRSAFAAGAAEQVCGSHFGSSSACHKVCRNVSPCIFCCHFLNPHHLTCILICAAEQTFLCLFWLFMLELVRTYRNFTLIIQTDVCLVSFLHHRHAICLISANQIFTIFTFPRLLLFFPNLFSSPDRLPYDRCTASRRRSLICRAESLIHRRRVTGRAHRYRGCFFIYTYYFYVTLHSVHHTVDSQSGFICPVWVMLHLSSNIGVSSPFV